MHAPAGCFVGVYFFRNRKEPNKRSKIPRHKVARFETSRTLSFSIFAGFLLARPTSLVSTAEGASSEIQNLFFDRWSQISLLDPPPPHTHTHRNHQLGWFWGQTIKHFLPCWFQILLLYPTQNTFKVYLRVLAVSNFTASPLGVNQRERKSLIFFCWFQISLFSGLFVCQDVFRVGHGSGAKPPVHLECCCSGC